jgi:hypothetical protein
MTTNGGAFSGFLKLSGQPRATHAASEGHIANHDGLESLSTQKGSS